MDADDGDQRRWELATESIVVKIRWLGVATGYLLVQTRTGLHDPWAVRAFLALGAGYAALATAFGRLGEVVLDRWPLAVSLLESVFIALLCYHDTGMGSPFRWYYLLSLICCAVRFRPAVAWATFGMHCLSLLVLWSAVPPRGAAGADWPLTVGLMAWVTWACSSLAALRREAGRRLERLNAELQAGRDELERRVEERTEALRASQARLIQQEKMAAFGLLAAGIAHEVGNPLAAVSTIVQLLRRRDPDPYTAEKLDRASSQILRIHRTVRELIDFSRPGSTAVATVSPAEAVDAALGIAKYDPRTKRRTVTSLVTVDTPAVRGVRDHLTQAVLNLVLNAVDATDVGGHVVVAAAEVGETLEIRIEDDGRGISVADRCRLFQPFFTRKPHGTGLGLFVTRQVVEEMGGQLDYRTEEGVGSTFTLVLPVARDSRATTQAPALAAAEGVGR